MDASTPQWLSTGEAAWLLGVTPNTIRNLVKRGELAGHRFGRVVRLRHCDIDEWLHRSLVEADDLDRVR